MGVMSPRRLRVRRPSREASISMKHYLEPVPCACGKTHTAAIQDVIFGPGVVRRVPECIAQLGGTRPFVVADVHTDVAAGQTVCQILDEAGIAYRYYVFPQEHLEIDEWVVGSALMHFDTTCDVLLGVGSGVINDLSKIISNVSGRPCLTVGTAPSMDGYASGTSSTTIDGLKFTLPSRSPDIILGDTDILRLAPKRMLSAGVGDMIAKWMGLAEWRISHVINGEYYCEEVASMVRGAVARCVAAAPALMERDPLAVEEVFETLIIGGLGMVYSGVSRPASGVEHYFSHVWDMRGLQFGAPTDLHGIQCATALLAVVRLYEHVRQIVPDRERARRYVEQFDYEAWKEQLRTFLGESAEPMIALEEREGKYRTDTHPARLEAIIEHWDEILQILDEELPSSAELESLLRLLEIPVDMAELGVDHETARLTFLATKDIRDKYVLSRLAWDLGIIDELCELL